MMDKIMKQATYASLIRHSSLTVLALSAAALVQWPAKAQAFDMTLSTIATTMTYGGGMGHFEQAVTRGDDSPLLHKISGTAGAEKFIGDMATRGLKFLSDPNMSQDQKISSFRTLLNDSFDLETIGRFVLGRYWKTSSEQQRQEYIGLFRRMVVDVYAKRFGDYKGQKFETRGARADGDKDTIVSSYIIPGNGPEVQVDWRVRHKGGQYKIVDVIVEGVSMSVTQRSDFAAVIQRGGGDVSVLLAHLRGNSATR